MCRITVEPLFFITIYQLLDQEMKPLHSFSLFAFIAVLSTSAIAQEENSITKEIQLGGLFASGNTAESSLFFAGSINIIRNDWEYEYSLDGLYASTDSEVNGQRIYGVASANYEFSEDSFFLTRMAHEDDRFSGYDSQTDITFNYGRSLLQNVSNMGLTLNIGAGVRWSRLDNSDFDEPILRIAGDYDWNISNTAMFNQELSTETGSESNIYRSVSSIETQILDNLSLRFSFKLKHQTEVPIGRKKTDTETAITLVMNF
jgi:putative salt-induced outer membrane protein|tara:strand:- start:5176 stop:5952 length:777 start_codon:yes stop_codon:yes gene_type:complete